MGLVIKAQNNRLDTGWPSSCNALQLLHFQLPLSYHRIHMKLKTNIFLVVMTNTGCSVLGKNTILMPEINKTNSR